MRNVVARLSLLAVGIALITLTSCEFPVNNIHCESGVGERVTEVRTLSAFDKMVINLPGDVYLHRDEEFRVEVTAQENIMDFILTESSTEGMLDIHNDQCLDNYKTIRLDVYLPVLTMLEIHGSGDVYSEEAFGDAGEQLAINIKGSGNVELIADARNVLVDIMGAGDVTLRTNAKNVSTMIEGSGDVLLRGEASRHSLRVDGTGNAKAFEMLTGETQIVINGSGDCEVNVADKLGVDIRGSGNVFYKGNPTLDVTITGTGEVSHVE
jgi:hypothetical protein